MLRRLGHDLKHLFFRSAVRDGVDDELQSYFDHAVDEQVRAGVPRAEAIRLVRLEFGNAAVARDTALEGGWTGRFHGFVESVRADLRYGLRYYARAPLMSLTMMFTLAIGIGVNGALFTLVRGELTPWVPAIPHDDRLMRIRRVQLPTEGITQRTVGYAEMLEYANTAGAIADVAGETAAGGLVIDPNNGHESASVPVTYVTPNYFPLLGVRPVVGTGLPTAPDITSGTPPAVLGYRLWSERFAGASDVVGHLIRINDRFVTVVGVAPERFTGVARFDLDNGVWLPLDARPVIVPPEVAGTALDSVPMTVVARLRQGGTMESLSAAARVVAARHLTAVERGRTAGTEVRPLFAREALSSLRSDQLLGFAGLAGVNLLILLIVCTNVSSLLVGRALTRRREIGLRLSLGAPRRRIVRQLLTEALMLAVGGSAFALFLLWCLVTIFAHLFQGADYTPDGATALFVIAVAVGTSVLFGLSPALHASRASVSDAIKESATGARSRSRLQRVFVIAQVALTQPLLVGLAAFLLLVMREFSVHPSAELGGRIAYLEMGWTRGQNGEAMSATLLRRLATLPGVKMVSSASRGDRRALLSVHPGDETPGWDAAAPPKISVNLVDAAYLGLVEVPIVQGRGIGASDVAGATPAIVIGRSTARAFWGDANPIGKRLDRREQRDTKSTTYTVIGITDPAVGGLNDDVHAQAGAGERAFISSAQDTRSILEARLLIRTIAPASSMLPAVREAVRSEFPSTPIASLTTIAAGQEEHRAELLQVGGATAAGATIALLLASIGLYAAVAFGVGQRTREIGVRMALGARQSQVVRLFFTGGLRLGVIGMATGLPLSIAVLRIIMAVQPLYRMNVFVVGGLVAMVILGVTALATWIPARRSAGVDPMIALRSD